MKKFFKSLWKKEQARILFDFQFSIMSRERGLWFDSDERGYTPDTWFGFKFSINFGEWMGPVPKLWKWKWNGWKQLPSIVWGNPWTTDDYWFTFRTYIPLPMFFFSISIREFGIYLGCKIFNIGERHKDRYKYWLKEYPEGTEEWTKLYPSATIRRSRWL